MDNTFRRTLSAWVMLLILAGSVSAQGVVTQWNFPSGFSTSSPAPSSGSGTAALIGGTTATSAGGLTNAGSTEAAAGSTAWNTTTYPGASSNSGTAGISFTVSTASQSDLVFRFDHRASNTSSRYQMVQYTLDGSTWVNTTIFDNYAGGDTWYNNRTIDLSGVSGANNNANFAVRIVAIFDPANNSSYTATSPTGSYGTSGTWRFDAVTLSAGFVWSGAGGNTELGTAANYGGGSAPGTTGTVLFGSAGSSNTTASTASGGNQLDQLVFQSGAPAYTISGSGTLTINAGVLNNSASVQAISAPVAFGLSNAIQSANNGTVRFNGNVNFTNYLSLVGAGTITLNGTTQGAISSLTSGNPPATDGPTIRVGPNSTLAGIGTIGSSGTNNAIVVFANGAIRGGDPNGSSAEHVGNLTVNGNVRINTAGILKVEASRNTSTSQTGNSNADSSTLTVAGGADFALVPGSGKVVIEIVNGPNALQLNETYTLQLVTVQAAGDMLLGTNAISASQTIDAANYELRSSSFGAFENVTLVANSSGTGLLLTFTPVPEPGTVLGLAAAALGVGGLIRRRIRKANEAPAIAA